MPPVPNSAIVSNCLRPGFQRFAVTVLPASSSRVFRAFAASAISGDSLHLTGGSYITYRTKTIRGGGPGTGRFSPFLEVGSVAKPELGNKHQCQHCGARFFDLNKSPIRCPICGTVCQDAPLPRVAQHAAGSSLRAASRFRTSAVAEDEEPPAGAETVLVSLDEADAGEDKVAVVADDDVEIEAGDESLLEEEEEGADDVGDLIDGEIGDEEER